MLDRFGLLKTSLEEVAGMAMKYMVFSILLSIVVVFGVETAEGKEKLRTFALESVYYSIVSSFPMPGFSGQKSFMARNTTLPLVLLLFRFLGDLNFLKG